ncbi:MAG: hypothetical protein M1829_004866 [Trizodia sp. TS-e1964]|nr:MAG: hypothetical protein M1829_004866 [Trizodia sp. TS-e1964]
MSSSAAGGAAGGGGGGGGGDERRRSFGLYVSRVKSVLKRDKSKRSSVVGASPQPPMPSGPAAGDSTQPAASAAQPVPDPAATTAATPSAAPEASPSVPATKTVTTAPADSAAPGPVGRDLMPSGVTVVSRAALQEEKARKIFEKYGLTLEAHEWPAHSPDHAHRVEKPIRMRIHRHCHRCQTNFGSEKSCGSCGHSRCKKCPRYPLKKPSQEDKGKGRQQTEQVGRPKGFTRPKYILTLPTKAGSGQDLVRKQPGMRIHRTCHRCQTQFSAGDQACVACGHSRCKKCPRVPAKLGKYPEGYPGDADTEGDPDADLYDGPKERTYRKPRMVVRWHCHTCQNVFIRGSRTCSQCAHDRCDGCIRTPPKKAKKVHHPDVVKSVSEKLAAIALATPTPSAT